MNNRILILILVTASLCCISCNRKDSSLEMKIIFLHHSTGEVIWNGAPPSIITKIAKKVSHDFADLVSRKPILQKYFEEYNKVNSKNYSVTEMEFPKASPYGWNNNPFDYYNIWVLNAGNKPFKKEPTLEILTKDYQVIIFKHCFPVSNIQPDQETADINSYYRSLSSYRLQYLSLRDKMHSFPETKFIVFTGAAQVKANITEEEALRARDFFTWVTTEWDLPDDNIYIWDLFSLETEGGNYLKDEYASSLNDSHPNRLLAGKASKLLFDRIVDIVENNGNMTTLTGEAKRN